MSSRDRSRYNQSASCVAHSEKQRFFEPEKDAELTVYKQQAPDQLAEGWFIIWYGYHLP